MENRPECFSDIQATLFISVISQKKFSSLQIPGKIFFIETGLLRVLIPHMLQYLSNGESPDYQSMWARTLRTLRRPSLGWIENLPYVQAAQDRVLPQHICGAIASKCKGQVQELQRRCASECGSTARHSPLPRDGDKLHTVPSFHQAKRSGCTQFILSKRRDNLRVWIQDVQRRRRTAPERLQNGGRGLSPRVRSYHQKVINLINMHYSF